MKRHNFILTVMQVPQDPKNVTLKTYSWRLSFMCSLPRWSPFFTALNANSSSVTGLPERNTSSWFVECRIIEEAKTWQISCRTVPYWEINFDSNGPVAARRWMSFSEVHARVLDEYHPNRLGCEAWLAIFEQETVQLTTEWTMLSTMDRSISC